MKKIAIIILAAGASKRMKQPKQLLPWSNSTLLEYIIANANNIKRGDVFTVLGANAELITNTINIESTVLLHRKWEQGMGSSIAFGVSEIEKSQYDGVLIILADQPFVNTAYLNQLLDTFNQDKVNIVASRFHGNVGVPAIFSSEYFNDLKALNRDYGAKDIIKNHFQDVKTIQADDLVIDIDTIETYREIYDQEFGIDGK
ncbi:nucleotidyltransferase family protein [Galbibacter mesophilus]|uniref:nucleotidyltransferase family protein n=1 Tax=Galbibacter mesophilus TaxID=379069 RepID=UPI00191DB438|nr:nucleotidyltransferase family protein [Galbibacter mesophilus]MCM5661992.1 nucleotidyltransferase family protein [Galbibacter mesophilus]